jgi:PAS domain S-box-containing protein
LVAAPAEAAAPLASALRQALPDYVVEALPPEGPSPDHLGPDDVLLFVPPAHDVLRTLPSPSLPPTVVLLADSFPSDLRRDLVDIWVRPQPGWEGELASRLAALEAESLSSGAAAVVERAEATAARSTAMAQAARILVGDEAPEPAVQHAAHLLRQLLDADVAAVYGSGHGDQRLSLLGASPKDAALPPAVDAPDIEASQAPSLGRDFPEGDWLLLLYKGHAHEQALVFALGRSSRPWTQDERDFADDLAEVLAACLHESFLLESLRASEARYRRLFDNVAAAVLVTGVDGRIRLMNRRAQEVSGYSREEMEGKLKIAVLAAPEEWGRISHNIATRPTGLGDFGETQEFECVAADGRRRRVRAQIVPSPGTDDRLITFIDVTVERDLHRQLLQAEKIASLGQLVSGVAHELNNPLGAILGSAELALDRHPSAAVEEHLHRIVEQTERCRRIMANLLTFARERQAERLPVDVNAVVLRALDLQTYALAVDNIQVSLDLAPGLPYAFGDPARLQQVVLNLLLNAHQAMRGHGLGRLGITTSLHGDRLRLTVSDTGPGISPENLSRIFDPFFSTKPIGGGTGLGLSVSMGIVLDMGGDLWAESQLGRGARFFVELPEASFEPAGAEEHPIDLYAQPVPAPALGARVLLIEDEAAVRDVIECALEAEGYLVQSAPDGQDAEVMLATTDFDAVLCDLRTPRLDGIRLYRRIATRDPDMARRFIIVTGDVASDYTRRFLDNVGLPVLQKPFSLTVLRRLVAEVTHRPRPSPVAD